MFIESTHRDRIYLFALLVCYGQIKHGWSFTHWTALFKYVLQSWPIKINVDFFFYNSNLYYLLLQLRFQPQIWVTWSPLSACRQTWRWTSCQSNIKPTPFDLTYIAYAVCSRSTKNLF